ncbi:MAG: HAMP domain-containing sensor histidine kinase [Bacteroidota bacterium]|nr:HAMP domain-containing sensor histidine kinase [Bacteroidota bacterium]
MKKGIKSNRTLIIFYILISYVILQFLWWGFHIIDLSEQIDADKSEINSTIRMIIGEAAVFILIIFIGAYYVIRSYYNELALFKKEKNFALSVTHELKTPIATSKLFAQTLLKRSNLGEAQKKESLEKIIEEQNRLNALVEKILLASSIDDMRSQIEKKPVNINKTIDSILTQIRETHHVINNIEKDLTINGDEFYLISLFQNLIDNALKYAEKNTTVTISSTRHQGAILIQVADEGIGIKNEFKELIFERFFRIGDEETRDTKGTGLGLFLVKEIVKLHDGEITCRDNSPKGTIFEIKFNS